MEVREESRLFQAIATSVRRFGPFGPSYEVLDVQGEHARIRVTDSGEELDYPLSHLLHDPEA